MKMARKYEKFANYISGNRNKAIHGYLPELLDDNNKNERALALKWGIELLDKADSIIICGYTISKGMAAEIERALWQGKKIYTIQGFVTNSYAINEFLYRKGAISFKQRDERYAEYLLEKYKRRNSIKLVKEAQ